MPDSVTNWVAGLSLLIALGVNWHALVTAAMMGGGYKIVLLVPMAKGRVAENKIAACRRREMGTWRGATLLNSKKSVSSMDTVRSRDSAVGIATGYELDESPGNVRIFSSPQRPDRLLASRNLLSNVYRWLSPGGKVAGAWNWRLTSN
jgi:hypothetical protein